jgi:hypothetical protein
MSLIRIQSALEQSSKPPRLLGLIRLLRLASIHYHHPHLVCLLAAERRILAVDRVAHLLHRVPAEGWTFVVRVRSIYSDSLRPERVVRVLVGDCRPR